jgi:thymidylate synthase
MTVMRPLTFAEVNYRLVGAMKAAPPVKTERWQGVAANTDTFELFDVNFQVPLQGIEDLDHWRYDIHPSLPWADDHFLERVGGEPLNPGAQWRNWPWAQRADKFRTADRFNHSYMERLWPRFARRTPDGTLPVRVAGQSRKFPDKDARGKQGIAWEYGDLQSLVELLVKEPHTRQAVIPLFFPEDTGFADGGRKPCTLLYQFMVRDGQLCVWYPLRSCDLVRHFRDDCYLAVRLLLWVLGQCRTIRPDYWTDVVPGTYAMHCTSLHVFATDRDWLNNYAAPPLPLKEQD